MTNTPELNFIILDTHSLESFAIADTSKFKIYGLKSTRDNIIRYIGYTERKLKERLWEHRKDRFKKGSYKNHWIAKEVKAGFIIEIEELDYAANIFELKQKEIHYIKLFKSFGAKLVNGTTGGEGASGYIASEQSKINNSIRKSKKIYYFDFNTKEFLGTCKSRKELIEKFNLGGGMVWNVLNGKSRQTKGLTFSYNSICPEEVPLKYKAWNKGISTKGLQKQRGVKVKAYNKNEERLFNSLVECANFFKATEQKIRYALYNKKPINDFYIEKL